MAALDGCTFALENENKVQSRMADFRIDKDNFEQQKAFELVANTNTSLFITGKAGTGKTTFVKRIQKEINKNYLVLAPTGIAALNVGGQTIHSFFGFPLEVIGPYTRMEVSFEKRLLLQRIDTIIIDEASMVRSDLVDGIDRFLRAVFSTHLPFGGKQVVFVGDLFQLPPVVKRGSADEEMLWDLYGKGTPYFYKAHVLKRMNLPKIEFTHVYRQNDEKFLNILNRMRLGENTTDDLDVLNQHIVDGTSSGDYAITLTSRNDTADNINEAKLAALSGEEFCYEGEKTGEIKTQDIPAPAVLKLKVGAQVIFCRNDYTHGCANGTIAKVKELTENSITVLLENGKEVRVEKMTWESLEKVYDKESHKVETEVVGTFTQYPLRLAWAITIHKSQGMTFDRMHFDLSRGTFMPGQAYVAISRMRTLEGLTLSRRISQYDIKQNEEIRAFSNTFNDTAMIDDELSFGKDFYAHLSQKDYGSAAIDCMHEMIRKITHGDLRNAALMGKKMFDVMLDDECLHSVTNNIPLLKDCTMTCNFLNAVLCQYGNRHKEAIGYVDLVLARRNCPEAMFVKAKALYAIGCYEEAIEVVHNIREVSKTLEDRIQIDKKQLLFEAKLFQQMGKPNIDTCKRLSRLCPEYIPVYAMIRQGALAKELQIQSEEGDQDKVLADAFNNTAVTSEEFEKMLLEAKDKDVFGTFTKKVRKIGGKDEPVDLKKKMELLMDE